MCDHKLDELSVLKDETAKNMKKTDSPQMTANEFNAYLKVNGPSFGRFFMFLVA